MRAIARSRSSFGPGSDRFGSDERNVEGYRQSMPDPFTRPTIQQDFTHVHRAH
jgi:hypothetical protein